MNSVREVLDNPKHTGYMVWNRRKNARPDRGVPGRVNPPSLGVVSQPTHEPLVTRDLFEAATTIGRFRQGSRPGAGPNRHPATKRTYLLRSSLSCGMCGRRLSIICTLPRRSSRSAREAMTCRESPRIMRLDPVRLVLVEVDGVEVVEAVEVVEEREFGFVLGAFRGRAEVFNQDPRIDLLLDVDRWGEAGLGEPTWYRWRNQNGEMKTDHAKRPRTWSGRTRD